MLIYGTYNYSIRSFYFFEAIVPPSGLYLRNSCPLQSCVSSASQNKLADKNLYQNWGFISPEILRSHVVETTCALKVIRTEQTTEKETLQRKFNYCCLTHDEWRMQTLDNTSMQHQLYFRDRHRVWIGGEQDLLQHSNAVEICYDTWSRTERSWHSLGKSLLEQFNLAAATRVESRNLTIDMEFMKHVLPGIPGLFLPVVNIKLTVHNQTVQIRSRYIHLFET